jgi:very-short-patch-repair endonuclease
MRVNINWTDFQEFYNKNRLIDSLEKFKISKGTFYKAVKLGLIKNRNKSESAKIALEKLPARKHSNETKAKISEIRKKFLLENPEKVPYRLNHSKNESYPEKYFSEIFFNENVKVVRYYRIGLYELDFAIPEKKIDIEIDGSQHSYDEKIKISDDKRNMFLEQNGWDIIRINWSKFMKLSFNDKKDYILNLKDYINDIILQKPIFEVEDKSKCKCGKKKYKYSKTCKYCYDISQRKVDRPNLDVLIEEIKQNGYSLVGRKYGVSCNCIRKWIKE